MACNCIGGNPCPCQGGPVGRITFGNRFFWMNTQQTISVGIYKCARCQKEYTVNDQWAACTPDFCHDCYGYLKTQYASVPVDKDGNDVPQ
jgi:hypothetical protein